MKDGFILLKKWTSLVKELTPNEKNEIIIRLDAIFTVHRIAMTLMELKEYFQ